MTSTSRVFAILSLFTSQRPIWQPDEINEALGYSRPTGYRYVRELVQAGMLHKVSAGRYALGARIIELDYQLRQSDPVLRSARPVMQQLANRTGLDTVLTVLFAGPRIIDIHRTTVQKDLELAYGRGRPRPLFRSGAPKVLLSQVPRPQLSKVYDAHRDEIAANGLGRSWQEFRETLATIRKAGFYRSLGELEPQLGSVAAPVFNPDDECVAALALVGTTERIAAADPARLAAALQGAAAAIRKALND